MILAVISNHLIEIAKKSRCNHMETLIAKTMELNINLQQIHVYCI